MKTYIKMFKNVKSPSYLQICLKCSESQSCILPLAIEGMKVIFEDLGVSFEVKFSFLDILEQQIEVFHPDTSEDTLTFKIRPLYLIFITVCNFGDAHMHTHMKQNLI